METIKIVAIEIIKQFINCLEIVPNIIGINVITFYTIIVTALIIGIVYRKANA